MKKHNILKVILLSILVVTLCTWIFPSASMRETLVISSRNQLGIFDLFAYFVEVIRNFPNIILMILTIGMFYGVAYKIPAYRVLLDKLVKYFTGKESIFLAVIMILIAVFVSATGLSFGILFVFPFVISIILLMGYNKLVAASVAVGSTMVGILGTTFGAGASSYINLVLGTAVKGEMITKVVILVIALVLLIYNVLAYAKKTKNNTDKVLELVPVSANSNKNIEKVSIKEESKEDNNKKKKVVNTKSATKKSASANKKEVLDKKATEKKSSTKNTSKKSVNASTTKTTTKKTSTKTRANDSKTESKLVVKPQKKVKIWPFVLVFDLVVIVLAISSFDWSGIFNISIFEEVLKDIQEFEICGFPIFGKILGNVNAFGTWTIYYEIPTFIILATCFLGFIYGLKLDEFLDGIIEGIKKAMRPMIYMLLLYLVLVIVAFNPFQLNITKFLLDITKDFNVIIMSLVAMVSSVLNVESTFVAQYTLPYVMTVITDSTLYPLLAIIFQSIYGLMMLIAPTSVILLGTLSYLDISYGQWLKHIWKLFLELLVVLVVIFFIIFLI